MDGKHVAAGIVSDDGGYSNQAIANHVIMAAENGADGVMDYVLLKRHVTELTIL